MTDSLLIPTENDYLDAHAGASQQEQYKQLWHTELKTKRDSKGQLEFPWEFQVVQGFFKQSDSKTDDKVFNYATDHMGRLKPWKVIIDDLLQLNQEAPDNVEYKLLFLARHGNGYHNQIVETYGLDRWNKELHKLGKFGDIEYGPDPQLTPLGMAQAEENHRLWQQELQEGAPIPSKFYVSPLQRSCNTLQITWADLKPKSIVPQVDELIRETCGRNLCDKRSPKRVIQQRFPDFNTDGVVDEEDVLYHDDERETMINQSIRINKFLQKLFDLDYDAKNGKVDKKLAEEDTFIATYSHAGTIRCFINVLGHRNFTISTGGMIPVVIKGTRSS
ncbi:PMU1 [Candida margitis]|uniref:PMU1 n=1 Tax=Candida margitis TaxID=1775924 RepID=UPI00222632FC|nr:PMU1 [Candida margitis]KAI5968665.1 PMU1 [Candida margitis]